MDELIPNLIPYLDYQSASQYALDDKDVLGVYMMSMGDSNNLLPFDKNKGIPNQAAGIPNYSQPEQKISLLNGLSSPIKQYPTATTKHNWNENTHPQMRAKKHKHLPNIKKASKRGKISSDLETEIHQHLSKKSKSKSQKNNFRTPKKNKKYSIGNATISRTNKHKSERAKISKFIAENTDFESNGAPDPVPIHDSDSD